MCVAVVCIAVGVGTAETLLSGTVFALVAAVFCAGFPIWFMSRGARAGRWDTHHVRDRRDRLVPLAVSISSVIVGLLVLILGSAPGAMIALVVAMLTLLIVATVITQWWKISLHAGVAAGAVAGLAVTFTAWWWLALIVVAAVGWSRVSTDDHTVRQVGAGAALGLITGGVLYAGLAAVL